MARTTKLELEQINARLAAENLELRTKLSILEGAAALAAATPRNMSPEIVARRSDLLTLKALATAVARRSDLLTLKALATAFKTTARKRDGNFEVFSQTRGWRVVPQEYMPS